MDLEVRLLCQLDARECESLNGFMLLVRRQLFFSMWKLPCKCGAVHVNEYSSSLNYQKLKGIASSVVYKCLIGCVFSSFNLQDWASDVKSDSQESDRIRSLSFYSLLSLYLETEFLSRSRQLKGQLINIAKMLVWIWFFLQMRLLLVNSDTIKESKKKVASCRNNVPVI